MKNAYFVSAIAVLVLAASEGFANAGDEGEGEPEETASNVASVDEFLAFQKTLRKELEQGRYGVITDEEMQLVHESQATLQSILAGVDDVGDLPVDRRVEAYNAQEAIKAVLTNNVEDRPYCQRRHTVGTHRKITVCHTRQEKSLLEKRAEEFVRSFPLAAPMPKN